MSGEAKNVLNKIKEMEKTVDGENFYYRTNEYTYDFQNFSTIKTFGEADKDQSDLLVEIWILGNKKNRKKLGKKQKKKGVLETYIIFLKVEKEFVMPFDSKIFSIKIEDTRFSDKVSNHSNLKILNLKQILKRLPIVLPRVKAGNTSANLPNQIRKIISYLYRAKKPLKKYITINEFSKGIIRKWILYISILRIAKHLILMRYYSILQIK